MLQGWGGRGVRDGSTAWGFSVWELILRVLTGYHLPRTLLGGPRWGNSAQKRQLGLHLGLPPSLCPFRASEACGGQHPFIGQGCDGREKQGHAKSLHHVPFFVPFRTPPTCPHLPSASPVMSRCPGNQKQRAGLGWEGRAGLKAAAGPAEPQTRRSSLTGGCAQEDASGSLRGKTKRFYVQS